MKTYKALRKPSTGEYWTWNNVHEKWMPSATPDLLKEEVTMRDLELIGALPENSEGDIELTEVVMMEKSEYQKIKPDFLDNHPLELLFLEDKDVKVVKDILKEANTHYVLQVKEDRERPSGSQFSIVCPTTTFANAYYHVGAQIGRKVLAERKED
jgi:hypothetical protein